MSPSRGERSSAARRLPALALLLSFALACVSLPAASAAQRRRARRAPAATRTQPVAVPRLNSPPSPNATPVPSLNSPAPRQTPAQTPTPAPAPSPAPAQQTPPASSETIEDEDEVVRVTSNLVVVPVSVTNQSGEPVQGLKLEDFRLEEEGRQQQVAQVGTADEVPLDIALLFDVSSSVTAKSFFEFQQEAAARFLRQVLKPSDRAAVFTIGQAPRMEQALASAETSALKVKSIPPAKVSTGTAFYDTVITAAKYLAANAPGRHRRVILAISDGDDNFSERIRDASGEQATALLQGKELRAGLRRDLERRHGLAVRDVLREVQRADAVFYSINPAGPSIRLNEISTRAQTGMQQVADATGGTSFVPAGTDNLEAVLRQIAAELRAQYLLQYYPSNDAPPGKFLSIKVTTPARADLRVRARQGYYASKPK
ncbi:MAG TPA: VWA domain-containing protein [Pyrinomonadaceae bacterium]|nr:VWA domain-containing protein [Pyrinomonadaceae bacterium]